MFAWQYKNADRTIEATPSSAVPYLLFHDHRWRPHEVKTFLHATYAVKREWLCANLSLRSSDVVLPLKYFFQILHP